MTDEQGKATGESQAAGRFGWPGALAVVALCALAAFVLHECNPVTQLGQAGRGLLKGTELLAEAITQKHVTVTFREYLESVKSDTQGRLLVAEAGKNVILSADDASIFGTTTSEVRVPVVYRYYIALSEPWELRVNLNEGGVVNCDVVAPALKALPNPAIDPMRLEIKSQNGWGRWNKEDVQGELMKNLAVRLNKNEMQELPQYFPVAREAVEKFVKSWMLREYHLPPEAPVYMKITFRNESGAETKMPGLIEPGKN